MTENQIPDSQIPAGTEGDTPPATPPKGSESAKGDLKLPEGYELIKSEDKNNLISARDKATEAARGAEGSEEFLLTIAKEREISAWYKENGKDFPDVTEEDLMSADSPEELKAIAEKTQQRITAAVEKKLQDVEIVGQHPKLSDAQVSEEVDKVRNSGAPDAFEKMVDLRLKR